MNSLKYFLSILFVMALFFQRLNAQQFHVFIQTNKGDFVISLYDSTPYHRDNFINLVGAKFYDSLLFHRIIKHFVAQAGDPDSKYAHDTALLGDGDFKYKIPFEYRPEYFHKYGAVGMARDDNPEKASSACQFYVVTGRIGHDSLYQKAFQRTGVEVPQWKRKIYDKIGGAPHLDTRYTVFGEVIQGMKTIKRICRVKVDKNNRPKRAVRILSAYFKRNY